MQIKTPEVYSMIEAIGHHFKNNISNRFTRGALSMLVIDNATRSQTTTGIRATISMSCMA